MSRNAAFCGVMRWSEITQHPELAGTERGGLRRCGLVLGSQGRAVQDIQNVSQQRVDVVGEAAPVVPRRGNRPRLPITSLPVRVGDPGPRCPAPAEPPAAPLPLPLRPPDPTQPTS